MKVRRKDFQKLNLIILWVLVWADVSLIIRKLITGWERYIFTKRIC